MKRQLFRIKNAKYPKLPKNIQDIQKAFEDPQIRKDFGLTLDRKDELYVGIGSESGNKFLVFSSRKSMKIIEEHISLSKRNYLIDGTFKIVPRQFYQLLVISTEYKNDVRDLRYFQMNFL